MNKYDNYIISKDAKIIDAVAKINEVSGLQPLVLFVVDKNNCIKGSLTDGDVRRALLSGMSVNQSVQDAMNKNFHCVKDIDNYEEIKKLKEEDLKIVPFVTPDNKIIELIDLTKTKTILPLDAFIMAGGKGIRLKPYTDSIPKPMLQLNDRPIIAHNIDRLLTFGVKKFYVSVNHLKEQIKNFLEIQYKDSSIEIVFVEEDAPLGTIGSLSLVDSFSHKDILVINADILTNIDFEDFYLSYKKANAQMSVATYNIKINIPYAVMETEGDCVKSFVEKPVYTYYSNAGIYLLNKNIITHIPQNIHYDTIDLIEKLVKEGEKVSHFLIRGYWLDIGNQENYKKAQDDINFVKF